MKLAVPMIVLSLAALPAAASPGPVGVTQAVVAAEQALRARAFEAEFEAVAGGAYYEIELVRGRTLYEARVDARTGKVIRTTQPRFKGAWKRWFDGDDLARAAEGRPLAELLTELERQTSGKVREVELETENGSAWYEVTVQTGAGTTEVRLDPQSGRRLAALYDD